MNARREGAKDGPTASSLPLDERARGASPGLRPVHVAALGALWAMGCGGGMPLLHPAQTLALGEVRAAAGFSANVATGSLATAARRATDAAATANAGAGDATLARGALVVASVGPGVAPFLAARVGIGPETEAGLAATGRALRADVRHAWALPARLALSVGVGGTAALASSQDGTNVPYVDLAGLHGWGADVPVVVGYHSSDDLYFAWLGARAGWEHVDIGGVGMNGPAGSIPSLAATRFWTGGLLGLAVGFRHVYVAIEADVSYQTLDGDFAGAHAQADGITVAPASALWWKF